ncbi:MAG: hypothetical protein ACLR8P_14635 [Clostridium fessum]
MSIWQAADTIIDIMENIPNIVNITKTSRINEKQNMIRWIAGAALGIACVGFGIHAYYRYEEREAAVQEMEARGQQENEDAEDQKNGILTWNGKKYRRNTAMRAILCMGIDTKGRWHHR